MPRKLTARMKARKFVPVMVLNYWFVLAANLNSMKPAIPVNVKMQNAQRTTLMMIPVHRINAKMVN